MRESCLVSAASASSLTLLCLDELGYVSLSHPARRSGDPARREPARGLLRLQRRAPDLRSRWPGAAGVARRDAPRRADRLRAVTPAPLDRGGFLTWIHRC